MAERAVHDDVHCAPRSPDGRWALRENRLQRVDGRHNSLQISGFQYASDFSPSSEFFAAAVSIDGREGQPSALEVWNLRTMHSNVVARTDPWLRWLDDRRIVYVGSNALWIVDRVAARPLRVCGLAEQEKPFGLDRRRGLLFTSWRGWTRIRALRGGAMIAFMDLGDRGDWIVTDGEAWDASPAVRARVRLRTPGGLVSAQRTLRHGLFAAFVAGQPARR